MRFSVDGYREVHGTCTWPTDFDRCADLAASVQRATEFALLRVVERIRARSGTANLCYTGGVALNSVANESIVRQGGDDVYIFPAAEDSGVSVGAAFHGLWTLTGRNAGRRICRDALGRGARTAETPSTSVSSTAKG